MVIRLGHTTEKGWYMVDKADQVLSKKKLGKTQARAKGIMDKQFRLSIRKDLQELKRKLYSLLKIDELLSEQYKHLSNAYWELEEFSRKFGE